MSAAGDGLTEPNLLFRLGETATNLDTRTGNTETVFTVSAFFFCGEIRTIKCECPVDIRSFPARRERHLNSPNLDTRTRKEFFPLFSPQNSSFNRHEKSIEKCKINT